MNPLDTLRMALLAIVRNSVRSALTALGIVIGVASVIAMVHLGNAATSSVTSQITSLGTNLLIVQTGGSFRPGVPGAAPRPFTQKHFDAVASQVGELALIAPVVSTQQTAIFGNYSEALSVIGTSASYFQIRDWGLSSGRLFEHAELTAGSAVCVIGATVVTNFYPNQEPLGSTLRLGRSACRVIGVLESKGSSMGQDQDAVVLLPTKAVQRRLKGSLNIDSFYVSALDASSTASVKTQLEAILRQIRGIGPSDDDDFHVRDMSEIAATLRGVTETLTLLLGAIAAVSLLVGGIGIMNIMLVSVTERTREIGIRLAIGAKSSDVRMQFLSEGIVLSCMGGVLGIGLGLLGTWAATNALQMPFDLSVPVILLGFGFSAGIGVVFGYFPARKASLLSPIESLRHE